MDYYYDVVASICNDTCRTDSYLICGGFDSEAEAIEYINKRNVSEEDYYWLCKNNESVYIEIEVHDVDSGAICTVITVD